MSDPIAFITGLTVGAGGVGLLALHLNELRHRWKMIAQLRLDRERELVTWKESSDAWRALWQAEMDRQGGAINVATVSLPMDSAATFAGDEQSLPAGGEIVEMGGEVQCHACGGVMSYSELSEHKCIANNYQTWA